MAVQKQFADVLEDCHRSKKTGALFVSIAGKSENLIRFYFTNGEIAFLSFGPVKDRECFDILDCYDLEKVVYFDGMKPPGQSENLPSTTEIIEAARKCGKHVRVG